MCWFLLREFKIPISLRLLLEAEPPPSSEAFWQVCLRIAGFQREIRNSEQTKANVLFGNELENQPILHSRPGPPPLPPARTAAVT